MTLNKKYKPKPSSSPTEGDEGDTDSGDVVIDDMDELVALGEARNAEASQESDTRETLLEEVVALRKHVDSFMASIRGDMAATRELVGRLKDRIDGLHKRHDDTQTEWTTMRAQMVKHHLEQSSGAETLGAAVRKIGGRLDVIEKDLQHITDPHKVVNPLKVQVAECIDGMTKLRTDVNRQLEAFKNDIETRTAELRRAGKPRLS